jgi:histidyl-tRNA synthetase
LNLDEATATRAKLNPLRLFDDKRPEMIAAMEKAPRLLDFLNEKSKKHFAKVRQYLDALGVKYEINSKLVRGFDYYTGTTFEFVHMDLGSQSAIGGGGRYDKLMSELGGQDLSGIGWGLGVDRTILAAEEEGVVPSDLGNADLFIIPLGTQEASLKIATQLRQHGKVVEIAFGDRALKGAMKAADKSGAKFVIVLGENEVQSGSVELKNMATGDVKSVRISDLISNF